MILTNYLYVEARIDKELSNIKQVEEELKRYRLYPKITTDQVGGFVLDDPAVCRIIGSAMHDIYSAAESIFKVVAERLDQSIPGREEWHKELLEQMAIKIPGVRIALLNPATTKKLHELRSFRHRFRNVYGYMLDFNKLKDILIMLPATLKDLRSDLTLFRKKMREMNDLPAD